MTDAYYRINTADHQYQIIVTHDFGKKTYYILNVDGKECMSVNVGTSEGELYLSMLKYNESCALDYPMTQGISTIRMVKGLLRFLCDKEYFTKLTLIDTSTFDCLLSDSEDPYTIPIPLAFHNITMYGKTWYERHFGARVMNDSIQERIQRAVNRLHEVVSHNETYTRLTQAIHRSLQSTESTTFSTALHSFLELLQAALENQTWMALFADVFGSAGSISRRFGAPMVCSLYYTFDAAINELFAIPFECESLPMEIAKDTILSYPNVESVENANPARRKSWSGGTRRLQKYISIGKHYTQLSLKRRRR